jgi:uncharacterized protein
MMLLSQMLVLLVVIGALAGILAGLLGVGGGIVLVPAFFYAFQTLGYGGAGLMQVCLATSLATIIVTGGRSLATHRARGAVDADILRGWAPGLVVGAVLGVLVAAQLRSVVLQALFGILATVIALWMIAGRSDWRIGPAMPAGAVRVGQSTTLGFLSVLMGIGGGSFGVPLMTLYAVPIHRAVGTASGFGQIIALPSVIGFLFVWPPGAPPLTVGSVNIPAFLAVIGASWVTAPYGAGLAHRINAPLLKRVFGGFLAVVGLNMLRKAAGW